MATRNMADRIGHGHDAQSECQRHADKPDPDLREGRGNDRAAASRKGKPESADDLRDVFFAVHLMSPSVVSIRQTANGSAAIAARIGLDHWRRRNAAERYIQTEEF